MATKRIHIIVVDPSAIIRCGIVTMLQHSQDLNVDIADMPDISVVSANLSSVVPDVLIINPSHLGVFTPSQLRSDLGSENLKIVALQSSFVDQGQLLNYDEVISIFDSEDVVIDKVGAVVRNCDEQDSKKELSLREKEIIIYVVKGMTNKQIADALCLSTHTVIAHRRNIANKLQIHSPSGLTIYAIVNKLVDLSDVKNSISQRAE